jgi:hypothetical protein
VPEGVLRTIENPGASAGAAATGAKAAAANIAQPSFWVLNQCVSIKERQLSYVQLTTGPLIVTVLQTGYPLLGLAGSPGVEFDGMTGSRIRLPRHASPELIGYPPRPAPMPPAESP